MSQEADSDICRRFNELPWHDSKLTGLNIHCAEEATCGLQLEVQLRIPSEGGTAQWKNSRLTFDGCRFVKLDLDLLGIQLCSGDISSAACNRDSPLKKQIDDLLLLQFDLPEERNPFEATYHYQVTMINPGGELNLFAQAFDLEWLD